MSEALLTVLKFCFLALLYLFLFRVVRVVVKEMRAPAVAEAAAAAPVAPAPARREAKAERGARHLRVIEPESRKGEVFPLGGEVTVGRAGGCGIILDDDTFVSSTHARLFQRSGENWVEDLGSTNGTFLNGERVTAAVRLRRGDRVQFGSTVTEVVR